jgi:phosphopantetheinyl transferase
VRRLDQRRAVVREDVVAMQRTETVLTGSPDGGRSLLTDAERAWAAVFRSAQDSTDFTAAHTLARFCAAEALGCDPSVLRIVQRCEVCEGPYGRPIAPFVEWGVSLAHSRGVVAAGVARGPIGVDVEAVSSADLDPSVAKSVLTAGECASVACCANHGWASRGSGSRRSCW